MKQLSRVSRIFFGVCIGGLGFQQFIYADFRPVFLPEWRTHLPLLAAWAYVGGLALIVAGIAIILEKKAREVSLVLGGVFLAFFLFVYVPYEIIADPNSKHLGTWTNPLKELAFAGGAFAVAASFPANQADGQQRSGLIKLLERLIPLAGIFFSITMISFGIAHFFYVDFVAQLVPAWIWDHIFWTYFAGVCLIGSGVAIILQIRTKTIALLLGIMIFLWFIVLHIPRAIDDPKGLQGNEVTSVFEALGFSGIAFLIAYNYSATIGNKIA